MEKAQIRAVIKYQFLKGLTAQKVYVRTQVMQNDRVVEKEVTTEEMIEKLHDLVLDGLKLKLHEIVDSTNVSYKRVHNTNIWTLE